MAKAATTAGASSTDGEAPVEARKVKLSKKRVKIPRANYEAELHRLQIQLVDMQEWVKTIRHPPRRRVRGPRRRGQGGHDPRMAEYLNPRICRIVALPAPTERERTQWYFQRYVEHLPAAGEIVLFDRSWYNRGGVERVMGFATPAEYQRFLRQCPTFERMLVEDGILLRKYWFSVSDAEQERRFRARQTDPLKRWKLSPMDRESIARWEEYSRAKDEMFAATDNADIPWMVVESEDKRSARINMIAHLLSSVPWGPVHARGAASFRSGPSPPATSAHRVRCSTRCPTTRRRLIGAPRQVRPEASRYGVIA